MITTVSGRKAVVHAGKTGWVYVLDAATGKLIRRSDAFVPQENMFAQPTAEGTRMLPGANGGQEWSPIAVNPELQYAYSVALHQPMIYKTHYAPYERGRLWLGSAFVAIPGEEQWGYVSAIDLQTGKIAWQVKTEQPMIGGATATAGGLVFTGEGNGWFKAYDARTGAVLWKFYCGAGVNAAPSVFEVDGEQFVAVAAGGNFQLGYSLGERGVRLRASQAGHQVARHETALYRRPVRRAAAMAVAGAALLGAGLAVDARAAQEPRRWTALDGRDWTQFAPQQKQAYVAGFLAGAAAAATSNPDTAVIRTTVDSLYRAGRLRFPLGHMVYATQLDEFYWWDNHVPIPLYLALSSINQRMNQHANVPSDAKRVA